MGEVEAVTRGRLALADKGATLKTVAVALVDDSAQDQPKVPAPPAQVAMTDELVEALAVLPDIFGRVQPGTIRMLTDEEHQLLLRERTAVTTILKVLSTRKDAIRDAVHNHMDLEGHATGRVTEDTEVDGNGHYVVARKNEPEQYSIPGTNLVWSREYRVGSVDISVDRLLEMYDAGKITREQYLSFTREVRVFDEDKAFRAMAKDPSLLKIFRQILKRGRPSTAVFVRERK